MERDTSLDTEWVYAGVVDTGTLDTVLVMTCKSCGDTKRETFTGVPSSEIYRDDVYLADDGEWCSCTQNDGTENEAS